MEQSMDHDPEPIDDVRLRLRWLYRQSLIARTIIDELREREKLEYSIGRGELERTEEAYKILESWKFRDEFCNKHRSKIARLFGESVLSTLRIQEVIKSIAKDDIMFLEKAGLIKLELDKNRDRLVIKRGDCWEEYKELFSSPHDQPGGPRQESSKEPSESPKTCEQLIKQLSDLLERLESDGLMNKVILERIFTLLEKYALIERITPDKVVAHRAPRLKSYRKQLELLTTAARLVFDPRLFGWRSAEEEDINPTLVMAFGYPGSGKTPLLYELAKRMLNERIPWVEFIKINCQRLTSLLEPDHVKQILRVVLEWIDTAREFIILFLDEAEGIAFERRAEVSSSRRELTFWVMSLWDMPRRLLILLVTNYPDLVDEAIRSRTDFTIYFPIIYRRKQIEEALVELVGFFFGEKLKEIKGEWFSDKLEDDIADEVRKLLETELWEDVVRVVNRLRTQPDSCCTLRNLYEGLKSGVKFFLCHEADVLKELEGSGSSDEEALRETLTQLLRMFLSRAVDYIHAFGGIFPTYKDICRYEDRYQDLIKTSKESMMKLEELRQKIAKVVPTYLLQKEQEKREQEKPEEKGEKE